MHSHSASFIHNVPILINQIPELVHTTTQFIHQLTLGVLLCWKHLVTRRVAVEVTTHVVRVEVVLLQIKRWRYFPLFIKIIFSEDLLLHFSFDYIARFLINQIALFIDDLSLFVNSHSFLVLQHHQIPSLVPVQVT